MASRAWAPMWISVVADSSAWEPVDDAVRGHQLLDDRRLGAVAQDDQRARDEGSRRPERPAQDDRALDAHAVGHMDDDPLRPGRAGELAQLLVGGDEPAAQEQLAGERLVGPDQLGERQQADAGRTCVFGERQAGDSVLVELDQARGLAVGPGVRAVDDRGGCHVRHDPVERCRAEIHVGRVQAIALHVERLEQLERGETVVTQPAGLAAPIDERLHEGAVEERDRQIGGRATGGAHRARGGRRFGDPGHPSDPSISSFTSRLNSIAYSIGSSLVNTSRNPWTMRFVASFSVRPRLMR